MAQSVTPAAQDSRISKTWLKSYVMVVCYNANGTAAQPFWLAG
jgi:hypothetical protein